MKTKHFSIFIILIFVGVQYSCKKYPENSKLSLRPVKHRLSGIWKLNKFEINGVDIVSKIDTTDFIIGHRYNKEKSINSVYCCSTSFISLKGSPQYERGAIYLYKNKESIHFDSYSQQNNFISRHLLYKAFSSKGDTIIYSEYKILKLTHKELKLQSFEEAILPYIIEFKKL